MFEIGSVARRYLFSIVHTLGARFVHCHGTGAADRKQAEEAQLKNEGNYQILFEANPSPMFVFDEETFQFLAVNDAAVRQYGWPREEFLSLTILDIRPVEEREKAREIIRRNKGMHGNAIGVLKHCRKDGTIRDMEVSASAITFAGRPGRLCLMNDITKRLEAETALRQSEERFRSTLDNMIEGCQIISPEGRYLFINIAAARHGRCTPGDLIGRTMPEIYPGIEHSAMYAKLRQCMKERIPQKMENEFIYPDGSRAWFELGMQPVPEGVFILSIDISDRKKAEEALHESEERFSKAFRFSPVGINIFRLSDGRSVDVNDAFLRLIGYEREEVIGHTVAEFNLRVDPGVRDAWIKSLKQGNNIQDIDLHIGRKDGQIAQVLFSLSPIEIMDEAMGLVLAVDITERKRAEAAAQEAYKRIAAVLENIADTFYSLDTGWRFTVVNAAAEKAPFGRPATELLGKIIWELYPGLVGTRIHRHYLDAAEKKCLEHYEALSPLNHRWYEVFMQGHADGVDVYMRDITNRKAAEAALKESEEKYRRIIETANEGILFAGTDGRITMVNKKMAEMLGYTVAEVIGKNGLDFMPDNQREKVLSSRSKLDRRCPVEDEFCFRRNDGTLLWTIGNSTPVFNDRDEHTANFAMHTDITELKQRECELTQLNRTLTSLGKSSQAMVRARDETTYLQEICRIIVEDCGHVMVWIGFAKNDENKSIRPVASAGFEVGYLESLAITWNDTERGRGPTGMAIRTGKPTLCRNMLTDPAFAPWREQAIKRGYAASIVLPLMDGEHAFGALNIYSREPDPFSPEEVALLTELTNDLAYGIRTIQHAAAHRSMEEQLAAHARELATANKELESFAYSVSHDLRAPLRAIYSFCGMLEEDYRGNLDETGRDYLARISAGAGKMNGLIDDIMSLSLISSHEIMVKDVDISAMAAEILAELQQTQPRRTVQFTIEPGIRVCADPRLIKIALTNLLQNAWKYTGKKEETRIGFGRETGHGEPAFFVRDNGSGFDMNNVERLFKPFSRLHKEREFSGTGIGLAIVNRVITRHGGRIWAEGRVNEGAVFRFSLPKCEDRPNAVPEAGAAA